MGKKQSYFLLPNENIISWKEIDGEVFFLQKKEKKFYELNATANQIWHGLIRKCKVEDIVKSLKKKFKNIPSKRINKDVLEFIEELKAKKIFIAR